MPDTVPYIQVFLSSPGDVQEERQIALEIIEKLPDRPSFRGKVAFRVIAWEKPGAGTGMDAKLTPQEAINRGLPKPSDCDIVVVIFWSRMGTTFKDTDGTSYLSGTHWELMDALKSDHTETIIFRRTQDVDISLSDAKQEEKSRQYQQVQAFFRSELFYASDGSILRGVNKYKSLDDFRQNFSTYFEEIVLRSLENTDTPTKEKFKYLPKAPELFVGRDDDIKRLKSRMGMHGSEIKSFTVLHGWPGVGKTAVMSALANDEALAKAFSDGILWAPLGRTPQLSNQLRLWARVLGKSFPQTATVEEIRLELSQYIIDKKVLIVVDDVWDADHARLLNIGGPTTVTLFTTRFPGVARMLANRPADLYVLEPLDKASSLKIMQQIAPRACAAYPQPIEELVVELEGLPLALKVAANLLEAEIAYGWKLEETFKKIREQHVLIEALAPEDRFNVDTGTTPTIQALLQHSTDLLTETERLCFALMGVVAPKPATFTYDDLENYWDVGDAKPIIRTLIDRGLLEYLPEQNAYWLHSLLVMHANTLLS